MARLGDNCEVKFVSLHIFILCIMLQLNPILYSIFILPTSQQCPKGAVTVSVAVSVKGGRNKRRNVPE